MPTNIEHWGPDPETGETILLGAEVIPDPDPVPFADDPIDDSGATFDIRSLGLRERTDLVP